MIDSDIDDLDPIAADAINALADQLGVSLTQTIHLASRETFSQFEEDLVRRRKEIDSAVQKVEEILDSLGDRMRSCADTALDDGIRKKIFPALASEAQRLEQAAKERLSQQASEIARFGKELSTTVGEVEKQLSGKIEAATKELGGSLMTTRQELVAALRTTTDLLRAEITQSASSSRQAISAIETKLGEDIQASAELQRAHQRETATQIEREARKEQELLVRTGVEVQAELRKGLLAQELRLRRLWLGELGLAALVLITWILTLLAGR